MFEVLDFYNKCAQRAESKMHSQNADSAAIYPRTHGAESVAEAPSRANRPGRTGCFDLNHDVFQTGAGNLRI